MGKHCPVTGRSLRDCDCGACDDLDETTGDGENSADEDEG